MFVKCKTCGPRVWPNKSIPVSNSETHKWKYVEYSE